MPSKHFLVTATLALLSVALGASCNSNPYSGQGPVAATKPLPPPPPPVVQLVAAPEYSIESPDTVEFAEGVQGQFHAAPFATKGEVALKWQGLPPGASYDAGTGQATWTPPPGSGSDPAEPTLGSRIYKAKAIAYVPTYDGGAVNKYHKTIFLVVHASASDLAIRDVSSDAQTVFEKETLVTRFQIVDAHFPDGPFKVYAPGLPAGARIDWSPNSREISAAYVPDVRVAKSSDRCALPGSPPGVFSGRPNGLASTTYGCREIDWSIDVLDPAGKTVSHPVRYFVYNRPQAPKVEAPETVVASKSVGSFYVFAHDENGEGAPVISVVGDDAVRVTPGRATAATPTSDAYASAYVAWSKPARPRPGGHKIVLSACSAYVAPPLGDAPPSDSNLPPGATSASEGQQACALTDVLIKY